MRDARKYAGWGWKRVVCGASVGVIFAMVAFAILWAPIVAHYYVATPSVAAEVVSRHQTFPSPDRLERIAAYHMGIPLRSPVDGFRAAAQRLLAGSLTLAPFPEIKVTVPFSAGNLQLGLPTVQLQMASLVTADIFLRAYEETRDDSFLSAAEAEMASFAQIERSAWVPKGLLWNDHAVAARASVLVRFWRHYRGSSIYRPSVGQLVLGLAARSARLLADPSHYTYRTNHGVMQDIALLQLAAAFPELNEVGTLGRIACERLDLHLDYYAGPDGMILEHSIGYQAFGSQLLTAAIDLATLNRCTNPERWRTKASKAESLLNLFVRPDGSWPVFGDTDAGPTASGSATGSSGQGTPISRQPDQMKIFPVSGFAVWWSTPQTGGDDHGSAQTGATWSYFPGHGHKVADEMSISLWAAGRPWITNTGYWPYGVAGQSDASGWRGANAPHLSDEPKRSVRTTRLRASGEGRFLRVLDLERVLGQGTARLRRQVVQVDAYSWLVLDTYTATAERTVDRLWTASPELKVKSLGNDVVLLEDTRSGMAMRLSLLASDKVSTEHFRGELTPFAGWVVQGGIPQPAHALQVRQRGMQGWTMTLFELDKSSSLVTRSLPRIDRYDGEDNWSLLLWNNHSRMRLTRKVAAVSLNHGTGGPEEHLELKPPENPQAAREQIRTSFETAAAAFPRFTDYMEYRELLSKIMLIVLALQEGIFLLGRRLLAAWNVRLRLASAFAWIGGSLWLNLVFLQP